MNSENLIFEKQYLLFLKTFKKYNGKPNDCIGIFLHCLHFIWDDSLRPSDLPQAVLGLLDFDDRKDINPFLMEFNNFANSVINWLSDLEDKEDFEIDAHIDSAFELLKKEHGKDFYPVFLEMAIKEFEIMLQKANVNLPDTTENKFDELSFKRIEHSSLEAASPFIGDIPNTLNRIKDNNTTKAGGWYEDLFDLYIFSCKSLDVFRKEKFLFLQKYGKIGPNEPCPCESGRKWKFCHGK